jgi:cell division protein FtsB
MASTARAAPRPRAASRTRSPAARRKTTRPARNPAGRRPAGGIRWDRVARISLLLVLVAILLSYVGPATNYLRSWQLARETTSGVKDLRQDNARLRARARLLQNPRQVELEARRLGMAKPGERVYVVRNLPEDP